MVNGDEKTGLFREIDGGDETLVKTDDGFEKAVFTSPEVEAEAREAGTQALTGDITPVRTVRRRARGRKRVVVQQPTQPSPPIIAPPPPIVEDVVGIQQAELETRRQLLRQQQIITAETTRQIRRDVPRFQETVPRRREQDRLFIREGVPFGEVRVTEFAFPERAGRALTLGGLEELVAPTLFGLGAVSGGVRTVQDIVRTAGFSLVEGTAELITQPRKVIRETGVRLRQDPFSAGEVVGELTVSGLISGGIIRGLPKGIRAVRTSIFERRIRIPEERLTPLELTEGFSVIERETGAVLTERQRRLFPIDPTIEILGREPRVLEPTRQTVIPTEAVIERLVLESGETVIRQVPPTSELLRRGRLLQERLAKGRAARDVQTTLDVLRPLDDVIVQIPREDFIFTGQRGLFAGRKGQVGLGGVAELIFDPLGKALERFDVFDVGRAERITPRETRFTLEGEFRARDRVTLEPRIITPSEDIVTSLIDVKGIMLEEAITTKEKPDVVQIQDLLPILDVDQLPRQAQRTRQRQEVIQDIVQETRQEQIITPFSTTISTTTPPTTQLFFPRFRGRPTPVRPPRTPRLFDVRLEKEPMIMDLFSVEVRSKGKFRSIGKTSSLLGAFNLGDRRVDRTAEASFRIRNIETGQIEEDGLFDLLLPRRIRRSKKEPGVFIERREKRISTFGELQQITFKGIAAIRGRRKGRGGDMFGI